MASTEYGVLVGTIHEGQEDPASDTTPHYEIWIEANGNFRAAVNVRSADQSELLVHVDQDFTNPTKLDLPGLAAGAKGFKRLTIGPGGQGLDYVRDGLFDLSTMTPAPATGAAGSLASLFTSVVAKATTDASAVIMVFGAFFSNRGADEVFAFSPAQGVHDVHMMQGNAGSYAGENTVNGDGALFVRYGDGTMFAFFARFATQSVTTDPTTGAPTT